MSFVYNILIVVTVALCTFFTRLFPFAVFGRHQEPPALVKYLGKVLPPSVIAILIIYCIKGVNFNDLNSILPQLIAISVVVLLHLWKRNNLLSIGIGTACYMVMVQVIFVNN